MIYFFFRHLFRGLYTKSVPIISLVILWYFNSLLWKFIFFDIITYIIERKKRQFSIGSKYQRIHIYGTTIHSMPTNIIYEDCYNVGFPSCVFWRFSWAMGDPCEIPSLFAQITIFPPFSHYFPSIFPSFSIIFAPFSHHFPIIFPPFSHHFPTIFPPFSHHFPTIFPPFSHHFPTIFPPFSHHFLSFSHHFPTIFPPFHHFPTIFHGDFISNFQDAANCGVAFAATQLPAEQLTAALQLSKYGEAWEVTEFRWGWVAPTIVDFCNITMVDIYIYVDITMVDITM